MPMLMLIKPEITTEYITIDLNNIRTIQKANKLSIISRARVIGSNKKPYYSLMNDGLLIKLSDGTLINIPKGFVWDLSSVPRPLWGLLPPDGDFELASLIHDYLYITKLKDRKFADNEILLWSKVVSGTNSKFSLRNLDNQLRYIGVKLFGWVVWNRKQSDRNKDVLGDGK